MVFSKRWARLSAANALLIAGSVLLASGQQAAPVPNLSADSIVDKLMTAKNRQAEHLQAVDAIRDYKVDYRGLGGTRHAEMQVVSTYTSPNKKDLRVVSQSGSRFLLDHILNRLVQSEKDYQLDEADSDIGPRNYQFRLLGTDRVAGDDAYVMEIVPRRKAKYLCRGKVWVNARDFAIVRLEGEPAKNPSFWISHTEMANTYQKIGDFWLPVHKDAVTDVRMGGKAVLAIDYSRYRITPSPKGSLEASSWMLFDAPQPRAETTDPR